MLTKSLLATAFLGFLGLAATPPASTAKLFNEPSNCYRCGYSCFGELEHSNSLSDNGPNNGGDHPCQPFGSQCPHAACQNAMRENGELADSLVVEELVNTFALAADGNSKALSRLFTEYADFVVYNRERRAVQLFGCSRESFQAHLPLTNAQVAELAPVVRLAGR